MAAAFFVAYKTAAVIAAYTVYLRLSVIKNILFGRRYHRVDYGYGYSSLCGIFKSGCLNIVKHYRRFTCAMYRNTAVDYLSELLFADLVLNNIIIALNKIGSGVLNGKRPLKVKSVSRIAAVNESEILRY